MTHATAQPELVRRINTRTILSLIEANPLISRAELARQSGLSRATVSNIVDTLLRLGLVREEGMGDSQGGRPPVLLSFNPSAWYAVGAELTDSEWLFVSVDLSGQVHKRSTVPIVGNHPRDAVDALVRGYNELLENFAGNILPGLGLGVPGLVDSHMGVIKSAADLGWVDVPFREMVENELPLAVYIINRHKAAGLVEARYGEGVNSHNLLYVGIGTGVAAAIFLDGKMLQGANSSAGELGHVTVEPNGRSCPCGNYGCLQQYVSGPAMATRARELIRNGNRSILEDITMGNLQLVTGKLVCDTAAGGDPVASMVIHEAVEYLGIALANVINVINPDTIVLGGPVGRNSGDLFLGPLKEVLRKRTMSHPLTAVRISKSTMGDDAGARGAAALVLAEKVDLIFAREEFATLI